MKETHMQTLSYSQEIERAFGLWLSTSGYSAQTARSFAHHLRPFVRWCVRESVGPAAATTHHVRAYVAEQRGLVKPNTAYQRLACLRPFFRFFGREADNPAEAVRSKREKTAPRRPLNLEESARLLASCRLPRDRVMLAIALSTGLRLSELVGLRCEDVDLQGATLLVHGKGSKERRVPLHPELVGPLSAFSRPEGGPLWPSQRGVLTPKGWAKQVDNIARRAGVRCHPHKLRTTCLSRLLAQTGDVGAVQILAGHEDPSTTLAYGRYAAEQRALDVMRRTWA
jgi:site-specific recombinase XerD